MNRRASVPLSGQVSPFYQVENRLREHKLTWLRRYTKNANEIMNPVVLVCFPHAGGAASAYVGWRDLVPADWVLFAAKYPGREDRLSEPCATSISEIVEAVASELKAVIPPSVPLVFFGHSMGSAVAYETAHVLSRSGHAPGLLVVSADSPETNDDGWFSPQGEPGSSEVHRQFIARRIAGLDPDFSDFARFPEIRDYAVSLVNADIKACDNYSMTADTLDSVPILALSGQDDPAVTPADVDKWQTHSTGPFSSLSFPGGHFYLRNEARQVVSTLVEAANKYLRLACNDREFSSFTG
jgi:pyochelin biosynthetic protein PchC